MQVFMRTAFSAAAIAALSIQFAHAQQTLEPVVVSANPLGADINDLITPVSVLRGDQLAQKQSSTLGQTLNGLPGVGSTDFGPNSSRPTIRGLDGDRVRVMSNGGASLDASTLSYDHAVAIEPLLVEQIEVVRGPAALQYGGSAIGGAVNVIDNRIPKAPVKGVHGRAEVRAGGAESEKAAAGLVTAGDGAFAIHVDGSSRKTDNLKVPKQAGRGDFLNSGTLLNSDADQQGGAAGFSLTNDHGYLGFSVDTYRNEYGTGLYEEGNIARPTRIKLKQDKLTLAGEQRNLSGKAGPFESIRGSFSTTDYKHEESAGGAVESTFKNKGWDSRIEGTHLPIQTSLGSLKGAWGVQGSDFKFSASSEEATFVPNTQTNSMALFVFEELSFAEGKAVNAGLRLESVKVDSFGGGDNGEGELFTADSKKFKPFSASVGYRQDMGSGWTATSGLSYTERAPTFYELYANGMHHATETYEAGNVNNKKEKGTTLELGMKFKTPTTRANFGAYVTEFSNFIGLVQDGYVDEDDGGDGNSDLNTCNTNFGHCVPKYNFTGIKARLYGLEADGRLPLASGLFGKASQLNMDWKADYVRGENRSTGGALPRISPFRLSSALVYSEGKYSSQVDVQYAARQNRYADDLGATPSYTMFGLGASYKTAISGMKSAYLFMRVDNLTDVEARNASSVLRDMAPAGARAIRVGLRGNF
ncbi:TonB-dependent receptor [Polynucleobacter sp. MWH-CaK5]|uniref:TonB-dependent receptor n=1 Tax=Polynucleobacter sp. MWH-CaK5 TaxID=2689107 RepID=UPI001BFE68DF|nr:TonB-dependent receptor [Polynucleobacter sp. MWH-CaK5]QWD88868.1 TonB-dependent receptor [Polynucleobacter sp. MWH-CaK5]